MKQTGRVYLKIVSRAVTSLLLLLVAQASAFAADPMIQFSDGTTAVADDVNKNFSNLNDRAWDKTDTSLHYDSGKVGIGTGTPGSGLQISRTPARVDPVTIEAVGKCPSGTTWIDDVTINGEIDTGECLENGLVVEQGNVGIGTNAPSVKLDVNGQFIRKIAHKSANGPKDEIDAGQITSRFLDFNKTQKATEIRIGYTDNLRTYGAQKTCRWEIRVDGSSCPDQPLVYDFYTALSGENIHRSRTLVGYCGGISSGAHQIQIWVRNTPGYTPSDCVTGWLNSTWVIEAEEVY